MGRPIQGSYKVDISHQEVDRILEELEQLCEQTPECWIAAEAGARWLTHDQGYEDIAEFEDALNGTFEDFLKAMPHIETKTDEKGRLVFRIKPEPPRDQWQGKKFILRVTEGEDLWKVLSKSQYATVEIPEMEFEISADGKRKTDSIYNHICAAVWNLSQHVGTSGAGMIEDHKVKIMECVGQLNVLLDVNEPFTWVVHDPSGLSTFSDMSKVEIAPMDEERKWTENAGAEVVVDSNGVVQSASAE